MNFVMILQGDRIAACLQKGTRQKAVDSAVAI